MEPQYLIQQMYLAYYGRPADPEGLAYWKAQLEASNGSLDGILSAFGDSQEYTERYAGQGNAALINNLYQQLFGRDAEAEGVAYYTQLLESGVVSLAKIAATITQSARGGDATVIESRVAVAEAFTQGVEAGGLPYGAEQIDMVSELIAGVGETTDVAVYLATTVNGLLGALAETGDEPGTRELPVLAVDNAGNATASGDLSGYDLSNVTGSLTFNGNTMLPDSAAYLPAIVDTGVYVLILKGTVDISGVALSSSTGVVHVNIYEHADIAMTSAQYQQIEFGQVGVRGTQQHIRFTDSDAPEAVYAHHFVESYRLSDAGQTVIVGHDDVDGGEIFGGSGDDTFISLLVDETWYYPGEGDDTLDFSGATGRSMVAFAPGEGDDTLFGFHPEHAAGNGEGFDSVGFLGVANAEEAAASIASITFIANGRAEQGNLTGSTHPDTPVDMRIAFNEGGTATFVDFLPGDYDLSSLSAANGVLEAGESREIASLSGVDLTTLFGTTGVQFENIA